MGLKDDLEKWCYDVFRSPWDTREGTKVPDDESRLGFKNEAIEIEGTVLYADIADSTALVDAKVNFKAAEIYKTFLYCAAKVIRDQDGVITAYDGDRIMAVFIGDSKNSSAAKAALKIKWAATNIVMPQMKRIYKDDDYVLKHVTGIDTSKLFVAKTGVRGANDLVWIGRAANYAAKLSALPATYTYITKDVYDALNKDSRESNGQDMWEKISAYNATIYRSGWKWAID